MAEYSLTDKQKELLRSIVPGLQDGSVETEWTVITDRGRIATIKGLRSDLWDVSWKDGIRQSDFDVFIQNGFFIRRAENVYSLNQQIIVDAVNSDFTTREQAATQTIHLPTIPSEAEVYPPTIGGTPIGTRAADRQPPSIAPIGIRVAQPPPERVSDPSQPGNETVLEGLQVEAEGTVGFKGDLTAVKITPEPATARAEAYGPSAVLTDPPDTVQSAQSSLGAFIEGRAKLYEIAVHALSDAWSEDDWLGFSNYADALVDFITNEKTKRPLVIGIDAPWGMGKTTLMHMIESRLAANRRGRNQKPPFLTIWFNAWKYDQEGALWAALALEVLTQVQRKLPWWRRLAFRTSLRLKRFKLWEFLQSLLRQLFPSAIVILLGLLLIVVGSLETGQTIGEVLQILQIMGFLGLLALGKRIFDKIIAPLDLKIAQYIHEPNYKDRIGFLGEFEEDFRRVLDTLTRKGKQPLAIFVDDLDRCAPPRSGEIMEAINIMLDSEHCVFVIGMDARMVAGSIEARYKDLKEYLETTYDPGGLSLGQRFLEKIVQINFRIPRVDQNTIRTFLDATHYGLKPQQSVSDEKRSQAKQLIKARHREGIPLDEAARLVADANPNLSQAVERAKQDVRAENFEDIEEVKQAIDQAIPYLGYNPRKIKRFFNIFRLQALIANRRGLLSNQTILLDRLAKWVIIATRWPDAIDAIVSDPTFVDRLQFTNDLQDELRNLQQSTASLDDPDVLYQFHRRIACKLASKNTWDNVYKLNGTRPPINSSCFTAGNAIRIGKCVYKPFGICVVAKACKRSRTCSACAIARFNTGWPGTVLVVWLRCCGVSPEMGAVQRRNSRPSDNGRWQRKWRLDCSEPSGMPFSGYEIAGIFATATAACTGVYSG